MARKEIKIFMDAKEAASFLKNYRLVLAVRLSQ